MKVSLHWLKEILPKEKFPSLEKLLTQMPLAGFEVESTQEISDDVVIDFAITPNRGDCLSIRGLAREIACLNHLPYEELSSRQSEALAGEGFLTITAKKACPLYTGRFIRKLPQGKKTPAFIHDRLEKCGIESVHPVVDICNYVMLLLGQPLHAFDAKKIHALEVRFAHDKEKLKILGGQTLTLSKNTLVIADKEGVQAIAAVIGGLDSGVSQHTQDIFLESAHFVPEVIAGRARQYGLTTEASQRFERGVDPALPLIALEHATQLILEYLGGEVEAPLVVKGEALAEPQKILLREDRITRMLGCPFSPEEITGILTRLGFSTEGNYVTPPTFRFDISTEIDLIEELARIRGYHTIPTHAPRIEQIASPNLNADQFQTARNALTTRGYLEVISYSFIAEQLQQQCFPDEEALKLKNPLSSELAMMRTSLWPSLLSTWQYNAHRQQSRAKFFEMGRVYFPHYLEKEQHLEQPLMLGGLLTGSAMPEQWGVKSQTVDFFDVKGDVEGLMQSLGWSVVFHQSEHAMLHPGQSADIYRGKKMMGSLGRLHPTLQQAFGFKEPVYLFECLLEQANAPALKHFAALSKFPSVRRDFAFLVDRDQAAGEIVNCIKKTLGKQCQEVILFDVYQGKNVPADKKSLALGVILQDVEETLSDEKVNAITASLVRVLIDKFSVQLRE